MWDEMESAVPANPSNTTGLKIREGQFVTPKSNPHQPSSLVDFIEELEKIDTAAPMAKLNETTISDSNGGRIEL